MVNFDPKSYYNVPAQALTNQDAIQAAIRNDDAAAVTAFFNTKTTAKLTASHLFFACANAKWDAFHNILSCAKAEQSLDRSVCAEVYRQIAKVLRSSIDLPDHVKDRLLSWVPNADQADFYAFCSFGGSYEEWKDKKHLFDTKALFFLATAPPTDVEKFTLFEGCAPEVVNRQNSNGKTPLQVACESRRVENVRALIKLGATVTDVSEIMRLDDFKCVVNAKRFSLELLTLCREEKRWNSARALLQIALEKRFSRDNRSTFFEEIAKLFSAHPPQALRDMLRKFAAGSFYAKYLASCLRPRETFNGAAMRATMRDNPHRTARALSLLAEYENSDQRIEMFRENPLDVIDWKIEDGKSALLIACEHEMLQNVRALLAIGATVDQSVIDYVEKKGSSKLRVLLKPHQNGAQPPVPGSGRSIAEIFGYDLYPPDDPRSRDELVDEVFESLDSQDPLQAAKLVVAHAVRLFDGYHYYTEGKAKLKKETWKIDDLVKAMMQGDIEEIQNCLEDCQDRTFRASFPYDPEAVQVLTRPKHPNKLKEGLSRFNSLTNSSWTRVRSLRNIHLVHKRLHPDRGLNVQYLIELLNYPKDPGNTYTYCAKFYGVDPEKEKIARLFTVNDDGSTDLYGGVMRQLVVPVQNPLDTSWIALSWTKLTPKQQQHVREAYAEGLDAAQRASNPTPGQNRLIQDYERYNALLQPSQDPLFKELLDAQWNYLAKSPENMDALLYVEQKKEECPLILLTEAPDAGYVWIEGHTASVVNGYSVGMNSRAHPLFHELVRGKKRLSAKEVQSLIETIQSKKLRVVTLTQKGSFASSSSSSEPTSSKTVSSSKTSPPKVRNYDTEAPVARVQSEKSADVAVSATNGRVSPVQMLLDMQTFATGDFLQDYALTVLENARFSIDKRLQRRALIAGDTWEASTLEKRLEKLPRNIEREHIPLLGHKLKGYQVEAVQKSRNWIKHDLAGLLALDAGLGKTLICLNHIFQEIGQFPDACVLVLCKKMLVAQWESAFNKEMKELQQLFEQNIQKESAETWIARIEAFGWEKAVSSSINLLYVREKRRELCQKPHNFYSILTHLFYLLAKECGKEGRDAVLALFKPLKQYDVRHVFVLAESQTIAVAETSQQLPNVLKMRPKVVVTTPEALASHKENQNLRFSMVIIDEADQVIGSAKEGGTEKELKELFEVWKSTGQKQKRLLVTATPIRNSITDIWRLLELVNSEDKEGRIFFNQLLLAKEECMRTLAKVADGKEVDGERFFEESCRLHHRIRYLRKQLSPLTFSAKRTSPKIIRDWDGAIPVVDKRHIDVVLNSTQKGLLELESAKVKDIFKKYHFEAKVKQHPGIIMPGTLKLIDKSSSAFQQMINKAPEAILEGSPVWRALVEDITPRIEAQEKCVIVCHHIVPQEILKALLEKKFAYKKILVCALNGSMTDDVGYTLTRFKEEKERPAVMMLINKSGGAGLDFPDATTTYMLGEEWNDATTEQIEARIVRVGVRGIKNIIYFRSGLSHEAHKTETSKMKKQWATLALAEAPNLRTYAADMKEMLLALAAEYSAKVRDGVLLNAEQKQSLDAFVETISDKYKAQTMDIFASYANCSPTKEQIEPYRINIEDGCMGVELPLRGTYAEALTMGALILRKKGIPQPMFNAVVAAADDEEPFSTESIEKFLGFPTNEIFDLDTMQARLTLYTANGTSKVQYEPKVKGPTIRILELPDGSFSPLYKIFSREKV